MAETISFSLESKRKFRNRFQKSPKHLKEEEKVSREGAKEMMV
jgi:hypothetical protein